MAKNYHQLCYHFVFATKNRLPWITEELKDPLYRYIRGIIEGEGGKLYTIGGIADHVHIFASAKPSLSVSDQLKKIKGNSSNWINVEGRVDGVFQWQEGYGAFSVSRRHAAALIRYIENQEQHHRSWGYDDELDWLSGDGDRRGLR